MARAAVVVGAGVSGLTTAVCLAEAGADVLVLTADEPADTTSAAAGAMWGPYLVEPRDRVRRWSLHSLDVFRQLADEPDSGVALVSGIEASRTPVAPPDWADMVDDLRSCRVTELPDGFAAGWWFTAPIVDMPTYLAYLRRRLTAAGGDVQVRHVTAFADLATDWPTVVNCAGLGARDLVPDPALEPIRGQLVVTDNPGITEFFTEDTGLSPDLCHVYPQGDTLVLGGTAEPGSWDRRPDERVTQQIVDRCRRVDPRLADVTVLEHRVGLRPTRPAIELREEQLGTARLIHNYGHGGGGVTLSWGCADEVTRLIPGSWPGVA